MVEIKSFGNNSECNSPEDMKKILKEKYIGDSISVISQMRGLDSPVFVDVLVDGVLIDTYTREPVEINSFFNK